MKKLILSLSAIFFTIALSAQTTVFVGAIVPSGSFGQTEVLQQGLSNSNGTQGGAALGFTIGAKELITLPVNGLSAFVSADLMFNPLKDSLKAEPTDFTVGPLVSAKVDVYNPSYFNIPIMAGLHYAFGGENVKLYVEAGVGANIRMISKSGYNADADAVIGILSGSLSSTTTYKLATTFAYQAGIGVSINNKYTLATNYYVLGAGTVSGTTKTDGDFGVLGIALPGSTAGDFTHGTVCPTMFTVRLGYNL